MNRRRLSLRVAEHLDGYGAGRLIDIVREDGKRVGSTYNQTRPSVQLGTWTECESYARLFAASEELLEVCKKAMDFKDSDYVPNALFARIEAAIAKAEGTDVSNPRA